MKLSSNERTQSLLEHFIHFYKNFNEFNDKTQINKARLDLWLKNGRAKEITIKNTLEDSLKKEMKDKQFKKYRKLSNLMLAKFNDNELTDYLTTYRKVFFIGDSNQGKFYSVDSSAF